MKSLAIILLLVACLAPHATVGAKPKELGPDNPVSRFLEDCVVGPGREYRGLALFPITLDGTEHPFPSVDIEAAHRKDAVALAETDASSAVKALGFGLDTVLILSGDVVTGGKLDRLILRDAAIRPRTEVRLPVLAVEKPSKRREKLTSFEPAGFLAPPYLRMAALRGDSARAVARLLDHYEPVLGVDPPAVSLSAVAFSARMQFLVADYLREFGRFPNDASGPVIGVAAVVGGRLLVYEAFGSPALFRTHWSRMLLSLAFAASGHEIRAGIAGQPALVQPAEGPARFVPGISKLRTALAGAKINLQKPLEFKARYVLRSPALVGTATEGPAGIVHLAVFPLRSSDDALYGRRLPKDDPDSVTPDPGEIARREREGTLTEYEKRWLERLRKRRARLGGPADPSPKNPDGGGVVPKPDPGPRPVRPGEIPGTERPKTPTPGSRIPPPGGGGGSGGGGGGGGRPPSPEPVPPPRSRGG
jgi:ARG and Rhodanese-Phosphatase-superfamily-associated Protein domain